MSQLFASGGHSMAQPLSYMLGPNMGTFDICVVLCLCRACFDIRVVIGRDDLLGPFKLSHFIIL